MNTVAQMEEWLLEQVEKPDFDARALADKLSELARTDPDGAHTLGAFAEEALTEKGRVDDALKILRLRAQWMKSPESRTTCANAVQKILGKGADNRTFIKNCGLERRIPLTECLDRVMRLRALKPGTLCADKTWGFGVVKQVDPFNERVEVDFEKRSGHELSMSYAAETLELISAQHIMAVKHTDPDGLAALVRDDPGQVVRMTLRSYGPLSAVILQEKLSPHIVPGTDWKSFWAAARKALKSDPQAVVPTKRTEPILLKDAAAAYGEAWFSQLQHDRDIESILSKITDWLAMGAHTDADASHRAVIENRLAFAVKGADLMGPTLMPRAMMLAHAVGGLDDTLNVSAYGREVARTDRLPELLGVLSAKDMKAFIRFLLEVDRRETMEALIRLLPRLDVTALGEVLQLLQGEGEQERCRAAVKALIQSRRASVELLSWLSRNLAKLAEWELCAPTEFAEVVVQEMEKSYSGAQLKAQNQLRARFTQKAWVRELFDQLGVEGRERFFARLKDSAAWPPMEKRSVLGLIIKLYPELEQLMTVKGGHAAPAPKAKGPVTSLRAFRERHLLCERIKTVDIPNNSKEIAVARAHGDLRENFEYQAAKDTQGLLMRRQAELEQMLAKVVPTDFEDAPTGRVGVGTGVRIAYEDGRTEQYYILGVWDRDQELGIISCDSKLAQMLEGRAPGEQVTVPTEHGEATCQVVEVTALPDAVRAWIRDVPESLAGQTVIA